MKPIRFHVKSMGLYVKPMELHVKPRGFHIKSVGFHVKTMRLHNKPMGLLLNLMKFCGKLIIHFNSPPGYVAFGDRYFSAAVTTASRTSYCEGELFKNVLFSKIIVHTQYSQCSCSYVETLVILQAKFHVVSSLHSVLKIAILMLS